MCTYTVNRRQGVRRLYSTYKHLPFDCLRSDFSLSLSPKLGKCIAFGMDCARRRRIDFATMLSKPSQFYYISHGKCLCIVKKAMSTVETFWNHPPSLGQPASHPPWPPSPSPPFFYSQCELKYYVYVRSPIPSSLLHYINSYCRSSRLPMSEYQSTHTYPTYHYINRNTHSLHIKIFVHKIRRTNPKYTYVGRYDVRL